MECLRLHRPRAEGERADSAARFPTAKRKTAAK